MATTNITVGVVVVSGLLSATVGALLPEVKPIEVHSLTYSDGIVHQERTITAEGDVFYANWRANVLDAETGESICGGSGSWQYDVGYRVANIPLNEWVGQDDCTPDSLPAGEYQLRAVWLWGGDQTTETSRPFTVE